MANPITILDLTMGKFRAQGVHQTGQQSKEGGRKVIKDEERWYLRENL